MESLNSCINHNALSPNCNSPARRGLADYSPKDKPWNRHRANADAVSGLYVRALEFENLASRVDGCSGWLGFRWSDDPETGESQLKLKQAYFCRVRYCPVCQWRRSLMWQARFYQALPEITKSYPKARWLFVTLTVRNCEITELGSTLTLMNKAWNKFIKRSALKLIQGWIRTTEVTRGKDGSAHPHFHILVMVPEHWFQGKYYVKQSRWADLWKASLQVDYSPVVDVRTVKAKKGQDPATALQSAVSEVLKYSTKADDLKVDGTWFLELTRQTFKKRFIASGGVLKDILKTGQESNDDLVVLGDDSDDDVDDDQLLLFGWEKPAKAYLRKSSS